MPHHEWLDRGFVAQDHATELARWAVELREQAARTVGESRRLQEQLRRRERDCSRSGERAGELGEDRQIGM
jgi:hypothetical protein